MADADRREIRAATERASAALRDRIAELVERNDTSVTALGLKLGYSRGGLRNSLQSKDGPKLSVLLELAAHLELRSIEELFGDFGSTPLIDALLRAHETTDSAGREP